MSRTLLSLAGFQVIISGRFWVIAEAYLAGRLRIQCVGWKLSGIVSQGSAFLGKYHIGYRFLGSVNPKLPEQLVRRIHHKNIPQSLDDGFPFVFQLLFVAYDRSPEEAGL